MGTRPALGGPCWCHGRGDAPAPFSCRRRGAGFGCPEPGEVTRRGRYGGVAEIPRKEGVGVGCRPSHPLRQTCAVASQAGGGAGQTLCLLFQQELLSHQPRVLKVTLPCKLTDALVLQH